MKEMLQKLQPLAIINVNGFLAARLSVFRLLFLTKGGDSDLYFPGASLFFEHNLPMSENYFRGYLYPVVRNGQIKFFFNPKWRKGKSGEILQPLVVNTAAIKAGFPFQYNSGDSTGMISDIILVTNEEAESGLPPHDGELGSLHAKYLRAIKMAT